MDILHLVLSIVVGVPASVGFVYVLGWSFSTGYHKAKREFVNQLLSESLEGKDQADA
jgi:hypothetical protein